MIVHIECLLTRGVCRSRSVLARVYQIMKSLIQKWQEVSELKASAGQQKPISRQTLRTEVGGPEILDEPKKVK